MVKRQGATVHITVRTDGSEVTYSREFFTDSAIWQGAKEMLHHAIDGACGPAVVADAIFEEQTGGSF